MPPTAEDLDDPLVAALALMAAEIDLDAVPGRFDPAPPSSGTSPTSDLGAPPRPVAACRTPS